MKGVSILALVQFALLQWQESQLILTSPYLIMTVVNEKLPKKYTLMMSSDYERTNWRETIMGLKTRGACLCSI